MIVVDASFLIALGDPTDAHHPSARELRGALRGRRLLLHPLTLAECLVGPAQIGRLAEAEAAYRASTTVVDFDHRSPARCARLRVETGLRLPDVIVLDTALTHSAALATFDGRLATVARSRLLEVRGTS